MRAAKSASGAHDYELHRTRHSAAVKIQKVARGNSARTKLKWPVAEALVRGRSVRSSLRQLSACDPRLCKDAGGQAQGGLHASGGKVGKQAGAWFFGPPECANAAAGQASLILPRPAGLARQCSSYVRLAGFGQMPSFGGTSELVVPIAVPLLLEAGSRQSPVGKWRIAGQIVSTQDDLQREQAMELQTANVRRFMETTLQEQARN
eukprot:s7471_g2.t2